MEQRLKLLASLSALAYLGGLAALSPATFTACSPAHGGGVPAGQRRLGSLRRSAGARYGSCRGQRRQSLHLLRTESYLAGLQKAGVGLLLDARKAVRLTRLTLTTDTPGYTALIEAGPAASGPFQAISGARTVAATTTFLLHGSAARYDVVWITKLDHVAHVNEVRAFARA
jgi:hypothetical protein